MRLEDMMLLLSLIHIYFNEKFMEKLDAHIADPEHNPAILVDTEGIQNSNYSPSNPGWAYAVSYTHLDVYKRQAS